MSVYTIGVLALQGAVQPHKRHIEALGHTFKAVKSISEILKSDALILPGGESSTMLKLIERFDLMPTLADAIQNKPVWGICAGCILLAETVKNPQQWSFSSLPITVERNGYGRQIDSHYAKIDGYEVSYIRAPVITDIHHNDVCLHASHQQKPVWISYKNLMATTFHPELSPDAPSPMHRLFIDSIDSAKSSKAA